MINKEDIKIIKDNQKSCPVRITAITEEYGIDVYNSSMSRNISGAIIKECDKYVIYVNDKHPKNRQRFTIAHEIAHYILHKEKIGDNLTDNAMYRSKLSNVFERQANILASEILMPVNFVMQFIEENKSVSEMASLFKVSEGAMRIRLRQGGDIFLAE
ncbi:ImmA/IrrE family metallo-endopeptidase [Brachyspira aalborgi]|jgi:Zn-dependent peptidase ImmA (M78 family)|uniref:ImmA/IrrE family metallo-endopeptidase n=1 Tax=Brachyspira aalborgi TaxID=29522 RepID=A0ABY3K7R8_9SPIR|nr:ImmA/IrrE family metallo-endopeptidase [Brachyspira aalborgi]TXJ31270.1 ImmA/IrrE family metallo-endopeptidase [Brachyspira aalborgi]TXJ40654.1 ImmA/IrrE family metallo-endopeptidase [Brachyspira aalborgi]